MQYVDHTFYCTDQEYQNLVDDLTKSFINCVFILDSTTSQKQIVYITESQRFSACKKIYKEPSTNALTATTATTSEYSSTTGKLQTAVKINSVPFDGSQDITITSEGVLPGTAGNIMVSNGTNWTSQSKIESGIQSSFNGVSDIAKFSATYSATDRQFTITYQPGAGYHVKGKYFALNTTQNPINVSTTAHANITGRYYCYFDISGILTVSSNAWDMSVTSPLYIVYYTTSNNGGAADAILQLETHPGLNGMPDTTRKYLHNTLGTQLLSGCTITQGIGITWSTTQGQLMDEDLGTVVSVAPSNSNYRMAWLTGTTATPLWNWIDVNTSGLYTNGTNPYYNQLNGSTWQLTPVTTNGGYFNQWVIATNAYNAPQIMVIMAQQTYNSLSEAQLATFSSSVQNLTRLIVESVILYKITYRRANSNPAGQYYSNIESISRVQQSLININSQAVVKQNIQQTNIGYTNLTINTDVYQNVLQLTTTASGKYNISYQLSWYNNSSSLPDIYTIVSINGVDQTVLQSYCQIKSATASNQYAIDLNVGDVVLLKIKQQYYSNQTAFNLTQANLQMIQVL